MNREDLLKHIAETGYNVGFGAKKHFATYDIVSKVPGLIGFTSMAVGILGLTVEFLAFKWLSATFAILGVAGLYISFYNHKRESYAETGSKLTQIFNRLKALYLTTKNSDDSQLPELEAKLNEIENEYYANCTNQQILFSDWYAHYKFFWQHQIAWIDEQKHFRFWRDKIPLSLTAPIFLFALAAIAIALVQIFA